MLKLIKWVVVLVLFFLGFAYYQKTFAESPAVIALPPAPLYCQHVNLSNNLWRGNYFNNYGQVRSLQNFLAKYYGVNLNSTGYYGSSTKYYVTKFQRDMGISPTGGVGPITRAKMQNLCNNVVVGGDRDQYGCIGSAGYSWCADKNKCIRPWEESCSNVTDTQGGSNCKVWYDGCNTCSRSYPGGPMMCTMMACIQGGTAEWIAAHQPVCREYFTNTSQAPVIKSFTGPTQLQVNQIGTWKIDASIFNNQSLTYNITWGDEIYEAAKTTMAAASISSVVVQNTTFEHKYTRAGNFTVTIVVTAQNGQTAKTTSTVNVVDVVATGDTPSCKSFYDGCNTCTRSYVGGPQACTRMYCIWNAPSKCNEYFPATNTQCTDAGISYNEGQSKSCIYQNGYPVCIADAAYVCRSGTWKIEGGLPTPQPLPVCTADAKQCPNGTWVGRTGPNCTFVCPAY
jgi:hypothetical protein